MTPLAHPLSRITLHRRRRSRTRTAATARRRLRLGAALLEGLLIGVVLAVVAGSIAPGLFGHKVLTVLSGSMEPTIGTGDAVLVQDIEPRKMRIGDVVTFTDPTDQSRLLTHRVRGLDFRKGVAHVVTKGDANTGVERWTVPVDGHVGKVRSRLPQIGRAFVWSRTLPGRILLLVVPAVLLCALLLRRIWRTEPGRQAITAAACAVGPAVQAARTVLAGQGRSVTVEAPATEPGDKLSAVVELGDPDVAFIAPLGWTQVDDRRMASGRLMRFERIATEDEDEVHEFRASYDTSIKVNILRFGADS